MRGTIKSAKRNLSGELLPPHTCPSFSTNRLHRRNDTLTRAIGFVLPAERRGLRFGTLYHSRTDHQCLRRIKLPFKRHWTDRVTSLPLQLNPLLLPFDASTMAELTEEEKASRDVWGVPTTMISPAIEKSILESEPSLTSIAGKNVVITGGRSHMYTIYRDSQCRCRRTWESNGGNVCEGRRQRDYRRS